VRKVILYIATSLDYMIADADGKIDWLPQVEGEDMGYNALLDQIDTCLMGSNTYLDILSFGDFPYTDKINYVFSSRKLEEVPSVKLVNQAAKGFVEDLKQQSGKDIWLIGGAKLITDLLNHHLIDELILTQIPVILGDGIPMSHKLEQIQNLELISTKTYPKGINQFHYQFMK